MFGRWLFRLVRYDNAFVRSAGLLPGAGSSRAGNNASTSASLSCLISRPSSTAASSSLLITTTSTRVLTTTPSLTTTTPASTATTTTTAPSVTSSYTYQPFVPLSRTRRQMEDDARRERHSVSGPVTSLSTSTTTTTTTTGSTGRRSGIIANILTMVTMVTLTNVQVHILARDISQVCLLLNVQFFHH